MDALFYIDKIEFHDTLIFKNSIGDVARLCSDHDVEGDEWHYLDMRDLDTKDFEGLWFDLYSDDFFERVNGYGIKLKSVNGAYVSIPGYGYNDGYYSDELRLVVRIVKSNGDPIVKVYDITECQSISEE